MTNVNIKLAMNSREKLSELPLNRFYRYVLEPEVTFDDDGSLAEGPLAMFSDMPQSVLFTMNMDTPLGWMVEAVYSPHDLDNIKLQEVKVVICIMIFSLAVFNDDLQGFSIFYQKRPCKKAHADHRTSI